MTTKLFKFLLFSQLLILMFLLANFCLAADDAPEDTGDNGQTDNQIILQVPIFDYAAASSLPEYILNIFKYAMIVLVPLAIVMVMWGGIQWVGAAGNSQKIAAAKKQISSAALGLILGLLTYTLLSFVGITQLKMAGIETVAPLTGPELAMFMTEDVPPVPDGALNNSKPGYELPQGDCGADQSKLEQVQKNDCLLMKASQEKLLPNPNAGLQKAAQIACSQGYQLMIIDGYRSVAEQKALYQQYHGDGVATPRCGAPHNTGGAVDVGIYKKDNHAQYCRGRNNCPTPSLKAVQKQIMKDAGWNPIRSEYWHFQWGF